MTFNANQINELNSPLPASAVKQRSQSGRQLSYIEGWHAIAEANRIFGFDAWTRETVDIRCVAERERKIGQGGNDGWGVSYVARVRVEVQGVVREGVGAGHGIDRDLGLAHESAIKEAETDAMKRALMTFGNPFGLALYDKTQANVDRGETDKAAPKPTSAAEMKRGLEAITQELLDCRTPNDAQKIWKAWAEVFKEQNWPRDYIDIAKERIQARGRELKNEAEDIFPGDAPVKDAEFNKHPVYAG